MDPVTQGTLGAALAGATARPEKVRAAALAGAVAGMAPDLDIFVRSATDPLLYLEFHRQFTHSLMFIPVGAAICALVLYAPMRRWLSKGELYLACLLGFASHGLLDACTSYGTQLLWPFSTLRVAWSWISVVDPLFSLPLLVALAAGCWWRRPRLVLAGLAWGICYLMLGAFQHQRALDALDVLVVERGHNAERLVVKPGFGNLVLWKAVYEHDGRYFVDGIRLTGSATVCEGDRIEALKDFGVGLPWLAIESQQGKDLERFRWYSDDWMALDPEDPLYVVDVRYSSVPNRIDALWGLQLDPEADEGQHATYHVVRARRSAGLDELGALLAGRGCRRLSDG